MGCCHHLAVVDSAAMNIWVHVFLKAHFLFLLLSCVCVRIHSYIDDLINGNICLPGELPDRRNTVTVFLLQGMLYDGPLMCHIHKVRRKRNLNSSFRHS